MGAGSKPGHKAVIRIYDQSPEIQKLREFFPCRANLSSNQADQVSREEFDYFLWVVRPEARFRAFSRVIGRLKAVGDAMQKDEFANKKLDWSLLHKVAKAIYGFGQRIKASEPDLFKNMGLIEDQASKEHGLENRTPPINPMVRFGAQIYPIYSMLGNDILLKDIFDPIIKENHHYTKAMRRLAGFTMLRNLELLNITGRGQTTEEVEDGISAKITPQQVNFTDPVKFQSEDIKADRYHLYFRQLEHIVREWSRGWEQIEQAQRLLSWMDLPYLAFKEKCLEESNRLKVPIDDEEPGLTEADKDLAIICRAFTSDQRRTHAYSPPNSPRKDGKGKESPGIQYQDLYEDRWETEGNIRGGEDELIPVDDPIISDEERKKLLEPGDDLSEEIEDDRSDSDQLRWVAPKKDKSRLVVERDTSYSQKYVAKLNQRLHWGANVATWFEIDQLGNYLDSLENQLGSQNPEDESILWGAIQVLRIVYILGVDIQTALEVQVFKRERETWRSGYDNFDLGEDGSRLKESKLATQTLSVVKAKSSSGDANEYLNLWRLSVPNYALEELVNIEEVNYSLHTNAVVFQDMSGLARKLIQKTTNLSEVPSPLFFPGERFQIEEVCHEFLAKFNRQSGLLAAKRPLTLLKLRECSRHMLVGKKYHQTVIDTLDLHTPKAFRSDLHYATQYVHGNTRRYSDVDEYLKACEADRTQKERPIKEWDVGVSRLLTDKTVLHQPPAEYPAKHRKVKPSFIGAAGLIRTQYPKKAAEWTFEQALEKLKSQIQNPNFEQLGSADWEKFCEAFNWLTLYCVLWLCCETSQRPHHLPYMDISTVDPCLGLAHIGDKTNRAGDRLRVVWLSPTLRDQMWVYERLRRKLLKKLVPDQKQHALFGELIWLEKSTSIDSGQELESPIKKGAKNLPIQIQKWNQGKLRGYFRNYIQKDIVGQPNFYRKMMPALLQKFDISELDISTWLGHWQIGTAPFHIYGTHNYFDYIARIKGPIQQAMKGLGFEVLKIALPPLTRQEQAEQAAPLIPVIE